MYSISYCTRLSVLQVTVYINAKAPQELANAYTNLLNILSQTPRRTPRLLINFQYHTRADLSVILRDWDWKAVGTLLSPRSDLAHVTVAFVHYQGQHPIDVDTELRLAKNKLPQLTAKERLTVCKFDSYDSAAVSS